tara:strand:- start:4949 stop:5803 length:855 start_codon:yes stop_codon:yes gene_type:complete
MEQNDKALVVCVDFTDTSKHAYRESLALAQKCNADIRLIHVHTDVNLTRADIKSKFEEMIAENSDVRGDVRVVYDIMPGEKSDIVEKIDDFSYMVDPMYLVVGYEVKKGLDRFIGPSIMKIIQECDYPVVALKKDESLRDMSNIVYPLLLNDHSMQKTSSTIRFAKTVGGTIELVALAVDHTESDDTQLKVFSNHLKERFEKEGVPYTYDWIEGDSYYNILLEYAHKTNADLLAVVFEQDPSFIEKIWGSKDEDLLSQTDIPLLIVKGKSWKSSSSFSTSGSDV